MAQFEAEEWDWTAAYRKYTDLDDESKDGGKDGKGCGGPSEDELAPQMPSAGCNHDHSNERAIYDLALPEKISRMQTFHARGNAFFEEGQYDRAYLQYRHAMVYYEYTFPTDDETWASIDQLRFSCNLNVAAAALKLGAWPEVLQNCYEALKVDPHNAKALYRRAQALRATHRFGEAAADLTRALAGRPHDLQLRGERVKLRAQVRAYQHRTQEMASRMLGSKGGSSSPSPSSSSSNSNSSAEAAAAAAAVGAADVFEDSEPTAPRVAPGAAGLLGSRVGTTTATSIATTNTSGSGGAWLGAVSLELEEPVLFDLAAVRALVAKLKSAAAAPDCSAALAAALAPGGGNEGGGSGDDSGGSGPGAVAAPSRSAAAGAAASAWVFGDLNRPGAFVRPRPKRHKDAAAPADCECCA